MKRVLITGATGYIGRRLVKALSEQTEEVMILTLNRDVEKAERLLPYKGCRHASAQDEEAVRAFQPEVVIHLATLSTSRSDRDVIAPLTESNIQYGLWLLDVLAATGRRDMLFVNTGSFAEYRLGYAAGLRPAYLYTASKTAFRSFVRFYADSCGWRVLTAVPYTVYGGKDTQKKLIDYLLEGLEAQEPVSMTKGEQVLDFVHVDDVVRFYTSTVLHPTALPEGEYHLGTGRGTQIRQVGELLETISGKRLNVNWGGRAYRPLDVMYAVAPQQEALQAFWQPRITLEEGLRQYFDPMR